MNKRYRLGEIEEAVSEMEELIDIHRPAAYDYLKVIINFRNIILDVD